MCLLMAFHTWICSKLGSCAVLSTKRPHGSLKDPDCAPALVYQIPWRAAILPHSFRVQVGTVCIWEAEHILSSSHVPQWNSFDSAWCQVTRWCMACDLGTSYLWEVALSFFLSTTSASLRCSEWQEKNEQCFYQQNQTLQVENDRIYERYKALMCLGDISIWQLCVYFFQIDTGDVVPLSLKSNRSRVSLKD